MTENEKDLSKQKGGIARAKALTKARRSEIAKMGGEAKWAIPQAKYDGTLKIADKEIYSAVLPNGKRLLSQSQFLSAIGRSPRPQGGKSISDTFDGIPVFLSAEQLKPFIPSDLIASTTPIFFKTKSGTKAIGYDAELLPRVCEVYLRYRDDCLEKQKPVPTQYSHIVKACDILMRGFAHVGIVALVDEATGYQYDRAREALAKILEDFISKELLKWVKTFPNEFYEQICRLKKVRLSDINKRPAYFGKITNDLVYDRLAPNILEELKKVTPKDSKGRLKHHLHRRLTEDIGHPRLREHLASEITLMRVFDDGDWEGFYKAVNKALPKQIALPLFDALEQEVQNEAKTLEN